MDIAKKPTSIPEKLAARRPTDQKRKGNFFQIAPSLDEQKTSPPLEATRDLVRSIRALTGIVLKSLSAFFFCLSPCSCVR